MKRWTIVVGLLMVSAAYAQTAGCQTKIVITDPPCGSRYVNTPSITVRGYVQALTDTVNVDTTGSNYHTSFDVSTPLTPCTTQSFSATVPLTCGCTIITVSGKNTGALARVQVYQTPPESIFKIGNQTVHLGGCPGTTFPCSSVCTSTTGTSPAGGGGGGANGTPTTDCAGGDPTCFTTSVVSITGTAATTNTSIRVAGPLNSVVGAVSSTPVADPFSGVLSYPWTASGLQLKPGADRITLLSSLGSTVYTTSVSTCVDLTAPPRVCLTFTFPGQNAVVATPVTTVVGSVSPANSRVSLTLAGMTQNTTPNGAGQFAIPATLMSGSNQLQLSAVNGATSVTSVHAVSYSPSNVSSFPFITITQPAANSTLTTTTVVVAGQVTPGATVSVQASTGTFAASVTNGSWTTTLSGLTAGGNSISATASHNGSIATTSVSFMIQTTGGGGGGGTGGQTITAPTLDPILGRAGSREMLVFSLTATPPSSPVVTIAGKPASIFGSARMNYFFLRTLDGTEQEGPTTASISVERTGFSTPLVRVINFTTDFTPPTYRFNSVSPVWVTTGTTLTVKLTASEVLDAVPLVTLSGSPMTLTSNSGREYSYTRTILSTAVPQAVVATQVAQGQFSMNPSLYQQATAVDAASNGSWAAIATAPTTNSGLDSTRIVDARDVAHPKLISEIFQGEPVVRVWLEGHRLIIGQKDNLANTGDTVGQILGLSFIQNPLSPQFYNATMGFPLVRLPFWPAQGPINHKQVEISGTIEAQLDVLQSDTTMRSLSVSSLRAVTNSELFIDEQSRTVISGLDHFAISSSDVSTAPAFLVVQAGQLVSYQAQMYHLGLPLVTIQPSAGTAQKVFCKDRVGVLGRSDGGIDLLDLTIPFKPVRRGSLNSIGSLVGVTFDGKFILACTANSIVTIDVSNMDAPRITGTTNLASSAASITSMRPIVTSNGLAGHTFFELPHVDEEGPQALQVAGIDQAGNTGVDSSTTVTVDYTPPHAASMNVTPTLATRGTTIFIDLLSSKQLPAAPVVTLDGKAAQFSSSSGQLYHFTRVPDNTDAEGTFPVIATLTDFVGLVGVDRSQSVIYDFTPPTLNQISIAPSLARTATAVIVSFSVNKTVRTTPTVTIGGQPAKPTGQSGFRYSYQRVLDGTEGEGHADVVADATSLAGNHAHVTIGSITTDFTPPRFSNQMVSPSIAKSGTLVTVSFMASETLGTTATVTIGGKPATQTNQNGNAYAFSRPLDGTETESFTCPVVISVQDVAGNPAVDRSLSLRTDFTPPRASNISATPAYLKVGATLTVMFTASESMATKPTVTVETNSVSFTSVDNSNNYTYTRHVDGSEGETQQTIHVHMVDDAGNVTDLSPTAVTFDFTAPTYCSVTAIPSAAKAGTSITFTFLASETLSTTPTVTLENNKTVNFVSQIGNNYTYRRQLDGTEVEGHPKLTITADDLAGNTGTGTFTPLRTDFTPPSTTSLSVFPSPTTKNTTVTVEFSASETLNATPTVSIGGKPAGFASLNTLDYTFVRPIDGSETEGNALVSIGLVDLVGNTNTVTTTTVLDFHPPVATYASVAPNYLKLGATLNVTVDVNKPLGPDPTLTYSGQKMDLAPRSGQEFVFSRQIDGSEGRSGDTPLLSFFAQDLAGNTSTTTKTGPTLDFIPPPLNVTVDPKAAKDNTQVTITVNTTETLFDNPKVLFGAIQLPTPNKNGFTYTYQHTVLAGTDPETRTFIHVSADDLALNHATNDSQTVLVEFTAPTAQGTNNYPLYATVGTTETITFNTSAPVPTAPVVLIGSTSTSKITSSGNSFTFARQIQASDGAGVKTISISISDAAGNTSTDTSRSVTLDFAPPTAGVTPTPLYLKDGTKLSIDVTPNKPLVADPIVFVDSFSVTETQAGPPTYHFERVTHASDGAGLRTVNVTLTDLAGNTADVTTNVTFDFTPPGLMVNATPPAAKVGTLLSITVDVTETLQTAPTVLLGTIPVTQFVQNGLHYVFTYPVTGNEPSGPTTVQVDADDLAGNHTRNTSQSVILKFNAPTTQNVTNTPLYAKAGTVETISFTTSEPVPSDPVVLIGTTGTTKTLQSGNSYTFARSIQRADGEGTKTIFVNLIDVAGNTSQDASQRVTLDFTPPSATTFSVTPSYVRDGTTLAVDLTASEPLSIATATVGTFGFKLTPLSGASYHFERVTQSSDGDALRTVNVTMTDRAGNAALISTNVTFDFQPPTFSNISALPNPISANTTLTIKFDIGEPAGATPIVNVGGQAADHKGLVGSTYTYTRLIDKTEGEGSTVIHIQAPDLAGNVAFDDTGRVTTDFTPPKFTNLAANPTPTTTGATVSITFDTSEPLRANPTVTIGEQPTNFVSLNYPTYTVTRTITNAEGSGTPTVKVDGFDLAGNEGILKGTPLTLDFVWPNISNVVVAPSIATIGTTVNVTFNVDKALRSAPSLTLAGTGDAFTQVGPSTNPYVYTHRIQASDLAGQKQVLISVIDLAGNKNSATGSLLLDFTPPTLNFDTINPTLAKAGTTVTVDVRTSKALRDGAETLTIGDNAFVPISNSGQLYHFQKTVDTSDGEGTPTLTATGVDLAGNTGRVTTTALTTDFTPPSIKASNISTSLAREGTNVTITFTTSEPLGSTPAVGFAGILASISPTSSGQNYTFTRPLDGSETQGTSNVTVTMADVAGNVTTTSLGSITLDYTAPLANSINVAPTLGKFGTQFSIQFTSSKTLFTPPLVKLGSGIAKFLDSNGGIYKYSETLNGNEGEGNEAITANLIDLAGNTTNTTLAVVTTDFTAPKAQTFSVTPTEASTLTQITATFTASETLGVTPTVDVAGFPFQFKSRNNLDYTFTYTPTGQEPQQLQTVTAHLMDLAGNTGDTTTGITLDFDAPTLTFDTINPTIARAGTTVAVDIRTTEALRGGAETLTIGNRSFNLVSSSSQLYHFSLVLDGTEPEGTPTLSATGIDLPGNTGRVTSTALTTDFTAPSVTASNISTSLARVSTPVTITFTVSEPLGSTPSVGFGGVLADFKNKSNLVYTFEQTLMGNEAQGTANVTVDMLDVAGNETVTSIGSLTLDYTKPVANSINVSPTLGKVGTQFAIQFTPSKTLIAPPIVKLGMGTAKFATSAGGIYQYTETLNGDEGEGREPVTASLIDLAGNTNTVTLAVVTTDFTPPAARTLSVTPTEASTHTLVTATFTASETLGVTPTVDVAGYQFQLQTQNNLSYTFTYAPTGKEPPNAQLVTAHLRDVVGNTSNTTTNIVLDFDSPTFQPISVKPATATTGTNVVVSFTASEPLQGVPYVAIGGKRMTAGPATGNSYTFSHPIDGTEGTGSVAITVIGTDVPGNTGLDNTTRVTLDYVAPLATSVTVTPTRGKVGTTISASFGVSKVVSAPPYVDFAGSPFTFHDLTNGRYTFTRALKGTEFEGTRNVTVALIDYAGNKFTTIGPVFTTDFTAPTVTAFTLAPTLGTTGTKVAISVTASEALTGAPFVQLGGQTSTLVTSAPPLYTYLHTISGKEPGGPDTVSVVMTDLAGNVSTTKNTSFTADYVPPTFAIGVSRGPVTVGATITVTATASKTLVSNPTIGPDTFSKPTQIQNTYTFFRKITGQENRQGPNPFVVQGQDLAGNIGTGSGNYFTDFIPPAASAVSARPTLATTGSTVNVSFTASKPLAVPPFVEVGGFPATRVTSSGLNYQYSRKISGQEIEGLLPVKITMIDFAGNRGTDLSTSVLINFTPPNPVITAFPVPATEGSTVAFSALGSSDLAPITKVKWSFAGLAVSTSPVTAFAFPIAPTTAPVDLTVTDALGLSATTRLNIPVQNVTPSITLNNVISPASGNTTVTWSSADPGGSYDTLTVSLVAQDLLNSVTTQLTANVTDTKSFAWDTRAAKDSKFWLQATITDSAGAVGTSYSKTFVIHNHPLAIMTGGPQPRYFNPKFQEFTNLTYTLNQYAKVSVILVPTDGSTVTTLAANVNALEGSHSVTWDGSDPNTGKLLPDGSYGYLVKGTDLLGNNVTKSSLDAGFTIVLQTTGPNPPVVTTPPAYTRFPNLTLTGTKDPAPIGTGIQVVNQAKVPLVSSLPDDLTVFSVGLKLSEGANVLMVSAIDRAGNLSAPVTESVTLKSTVPSVPLITSTVPVTTTAASLTISGLKDPTTALVVNSATGLFDGLSSWSQTFPLIASTNTFTFAAQDQAGNVSANVTASTYRVPNAIALPTVTVSATTNLTAVNVSGTKQANTDVTIQNTDNNASINLAVTPSTAWSTRLAVAQEELNHFTVVCRDAIGSPSAPVSFTILRDTQAPYIALAPGLANAILPNGPVTVGIVYHDQPLQPDTGSTHVLSGIDVSSVKLVLDNVDVTASATVTSAAAMLSPQKLSSGAHTLSGSAKDVAGNLAQISGTFYVIPADNGQPTAVTVSGVANGMFCPAYNPYEPIHNAQAALNFTVTAPVTCTMTVTTLSGLPVRTLSVQQCYPATVNVIRWDGADSTGNPVLDGNYYLNLQAVNFYGRTTNVSPSVVQVHY